MKGLCSGSLRVGLVQMRCGEDTAVNLERAIAAVESAADAGAVLVCLPELFRSRYFCQSVDARFFDLAEPIPGPTTDRLRELAAARGVAIIAALFERRGAGVYHNTAVLIDADGTLVGRYRKMHLPQDAYFHEKFYFTPGDLGFASFATRFARVGMLLCWDQWFPEAARLTALQGAQILFYPTAIGWPAEEPAEPRAEPLRAWQTVQLGHAIANGVFVAAVNRVGREGALEFWGHSFVADPMGNVLAQAGADEETLLALCDLDRIEQVRRDWPLLRDRRVDAYDGLRQQLVD